MCASACVCMCSGMFFTCCIIVYYWEFILCVNCFMCTINFLVEFLAIPALNPQKCTAVKIYGSFKVVVECIPAHCI